MGDPSARGALGRRGQHGEELRCIGSVNVKNSPHGTSCPQYCQQPSTVDDGIGRSSRRRVSAISIAIRRRLRALPPTERTAGTFMLGRRTTTVSVTVLDNIHDEREETLTLRLCERVGDDGR